MEDLRFRVNTYCRNVWLVANNVCRDIKLMLMVGPTAEPSLPPAPHVNVESGEAGDTVLVHVTCQYSSSAAVLIGRRDGMENIE